MMTNFDIGNRIVALSFVKQTQENCLDNVETMYKYWLISIVEMAPLGYEGGCEGQKIPVAASL